MLFIFKVNALIFNLRYVRIVKLMSGEQRKHSLVPNNKTATFIYNHQI